MGNRATWTIIKHLRRDESGATLIEFTLIAVLFFLITFSVIEIGLAAWWWTSAEKATQLGARMAVVSNTEGGVLPATNALAGGGVFGQPCRPPVSACIGFDTITCDGCLDEGHRIFQRMQAIFPYLEPDNVVIRYEYVQLGFAGGPPVPAVTVELQGIRFPFIVIDALVNLISGGGFPDGIDMPAMRATLTGEDLNTAGVP
jgi:Flp pilus assembly pilin Flp